MALMLPEREEICLRTPSTRERKSGLERMVGPVGAASVFCGVAPGCEYCEVWE
jgi:hypothetical protein